MRWSIDSQRVASLAASRRTRAESSACTRIARCSRDRLGTIQPGAFKIVAPDPAIAGEWVDVGGDQDPLHLGEAIGGEPVRHALERRHAEVCLA